ncbi:MAG: peptidoglycan-binding domain-containing protein [Methyloligellaceae bacterium]
MLHSAKVVLISIVTSTVLVFGAGWYLKYSAEHGVERLSKAIEIETQRRDVEQYLEQNPYVPKSNSLADNNTVPDPISMPQSIRKSDRSLTERRPRILADNSDRLFPESVELEDSAELRSRTTSHQVETTGSVKVAHVPGNIAVEDERPSAPQSQKPGHKSKNESAGTPKRDPKLIREFQAQLKRVGCYEGDLDGIWGAQSQTALNRYRKFKGLKKNTEFPNMVALQSVVSSKQNVCRVKSEKNNVAVGPKKSEPGKENGSVRFRKCIQACRLESLRDLQECVAIC